MMYSGPVLPDYWSKLHFKENEQTSYLLHTSFRSHSHYGDKEPTTHFNRQKRPPKEQNNYTQTIFLIGRKEVEERAAKSLLWAAAHCPNWMRSGAPVIDRADFAGALKSQCLGKSSTHLSDGGRWSCAYLCPEEQGGKLRCQDQGNKRVWWKKMKL